MLLLNRTHDIIYMFGGECNMNFIHKLFRNISFTVIVLGVFFCLSLWVEKVFQTYSPIPALFALAVFFVSLVTEGYIYGIVASLH